MSSVAVINYQLGNIFSVEQACRKVGLNPVITNELSVIDKCDMIILPGVGSFSYAMNELNKRGLVKYFSDGSMKDKIIVGICLGMQLFMDWSDENGRNIGLGLISGGVKKLASSKVAPIPHIGWNKLNISNNVNNGIFKNIDNETFMYFVHSYYVEPDDPNIIATHTTYGDNEFCSSYNSNNIIGFQFHPEKSGKDGLSLYENLKKLI